ncbi:MAG: type II toxin-antitoxin system RelE/ParE family toxin [Desulfobacula sp.]|nr:type II toxin-antitoxin system RelE/ParE family toxin [Desulfobacula sp.]MBT4024496.1 type II toxin-antitoxin system RelE/ParE family toxin [Desulfobacula sp.]MBT4199816.1 type II toxin-antitoxin system RelE/ParE family toxin [Desulfobacula sp.]MBT4507808.1 type II toxin-antitoxin system RelE/ParE family toxin [Desulfobacula sp.]MBT5547195.1 type II toxin-antitoxin system RelE/ParE family toxin [Desulfobacula sp.]
MKRLCTKWFKKWAKKVKLSNHHLIEAIDNLEKGLSVADLVGADLLGIDARQIEDLKKKQGLFNLEV